MIEMNKPVAVRRLTRPNGEVVEVSIGTPVADGEDWFTPWTITGLPDGDVAMISGGVDSLGSLLFALAAAGDRIGTTGPLRYLGEDELGLLQTTSTEDEPVWRASVTVTTV